MATRKGIVKKTVLSAYSRPRTGGLIAISLQEGDELIDVVIVTPKDDLILSTAKGMAIRFSEMDCRSMGRDTRGVKGISLRGDDVVVGMVVANPQLDLLTVSENGYGKRTPIGAEAPPTEAVNGEGSEDAEVAETAEPPAEEDGGEDSAASSGMKYRRQRRGGLGLRDIRTSERNGKAVDVVTVSETDQVLMVTSNGIIQRIRVADIRRIGRNTQGVRIIRLDEGDKLVSLAVVPNEDEAVDAVEEVPPATPAPPEASENAE
jgi:DNA gyrase subunit A